MKYYIFTLFFLLLFLSLIGGSAEARNEYLNEYGARCGDFETRIEVEDRETDYTSSNSDYEQDNYRLNFTYRKFNL